MPNTYDVLRQAGLTPPLTCAGCGNRISETVIPWPGNGYVTHPNARCSQAAMRKEEDGELDQPPVPEDDPVFLVARGCPAQAGCACNGACQESVPVVAAATYWRVVGERDEARRRLTNA